MKIKVLHFTVHKNTDSMNFFCKKKKNPQNKKYIYLTNKIGKSLIKCS